MALVADIEKAFINTIKHHSSKYEKENPAFVKKMMESFYVDDLVSGKNSRDKAYARFKKASDMNGATVTDKISRDNNAKRERRGENSYRSFAKTFLAVPGNYLGRRF